MSTASAELRIWLERHASARGGRLIGFAPMPYRDVYEIVAELDGVIVSASISSRVVMAAGITATAELGRRMIESMLHGIKVNRAEAERVAAELDRIDWSWTDG